MQAVNPLAEVHFRWKLLLSSKPCLVPNGGGSGGAVGRDGSSKPGLCRNCGKPGHWSRECPNKKLDGSGGDCGRGRGAGGGQGGDGRAAGRGNSGGNNQCSWRSTVPLPGSDQTKTYNGKTFYWCAKCNRWTTTHTTVTHKKKSEGDASPAANFSLLPDPSAWHAGFGSSTLSEDLLGYFRGALFRTHLWFRRGGLFVLADSPPSPFL